MSASSPSPEVVVAGAGPMAEEHVKALLAAAIPPERVLVVGRGRVRAETLAARYGVTAAWGGAEAIGQSPPVAIVAVAEDSLAPAAGALAARGATHILVEKPAALASAGLEPLREARAAVFVAYNRRFYASVERARELIDADGGPIAVAFDFTEVESLVLRDAGRRNLPAEVLARWGIANSLHVIDLAFHLGGEPSMLRAERSGSLDWHPAGAVFAGSGTTARGALFAYTAAWSGAGRWSVEVVTPARKLVLRPLETLQEQLRGSFALEPVHLPPEPEGLKPGLRAQLAAFLAARDASPDPRLCTLDQAAARLRQAEEILGYA